MHVIEHASRAIVHRAHTHHDRHTHVTSGSARGESRFVFESRNTDRFCKRCNTDRFCKRAASEAALGGGRATCPVATATATCCRCYRARTAACARGRRQSTAQRAPRSPANPTKRNVIELNRHPAVLKALKRVLSRMNRVEHLISRQSKQNTGSRRDM